MLFLIEYDRNQGQVITIQEFDDSEKAQNARLEMEIKLNRLGISHEIVVLEAATEEALRRTHRRYFENLGELMKTS